MTNKIKCESCGYGIMVNEAGRVLLCDNPNLKTYGKNVKHGRNFSCGYGVPWDAAKNNDIETIK